MNIYVAGSSSKTERGRAAHAMAAIEQTPGLELAHHWVRQIEEWGTSNDGITPRESRRLSSLAIDRVLDAALFWLLVPEVGSMGAGAELGAFTVARSYLVRTPRWIIASGGRRDVSIFVGQADHYFEKDVDALLWIRSMARDEERNFKGLEGNGL